MAAALAAADGGAEVVLFERRSVLGGLTASIRHNGLSFDNGQHVFLRCCTAYRGFIDRIGAAGRCSCRTGSTCRCSRRTARRLDQEVQPSRPVAPRRVARALRPPVARERTSLVAPRSRSASSTPTTPRSTTSRSGTGSVPTGRANAVDRLWNLIALPTLNVPAAGASLALATKVFRVGLLDRSDAGDIGWSRVPLGELHGLTGARALQVAGVETALGSAVGAIARAPLVLSP